MHRPLTAGLLLLLVLAVTTPSRDPVHAELPLVVESNITSESSLELTVRAPRGLTSWAATVEGGALLVEARETLVPITIIFAVETSSSMADGLDERALAAVRSVSESLSGERFALIVFSDSVRVAQAPSLDGSAVVANLAANDAARGSALYEGLLGAAELAGALDGPATVVLITRGRNFGVNTTVTRDEALTALSASGARAFAIVLGSDADRELIDGVAATADGVSYGDGLPDLQSIVFLIASRGESRYALSIATAALSPGEHELLISASGASAIAARIAYQQPVPTSPPLPALTSVPAAPTAQPGSAPPGVTSDVARAETEPSPVDRLRLPMIVAAILGGVATAALVAWRRKAGRLKAEAGARHTPADGRLSSTPRPTLLDAGAATAARDATGATVTVAVTAAGGATVEFEVGAALVTIGSSLHCDVRLTGNSVHPVHAVATRALDGAVQLVGVGAPTGRGESSLLSRDGAPLAIDGLQFALRRRSAA